MIGFECARVGLAFAFVFAWAFAHQACVAQNAVRSAFAYGQIEGFDESARPETRGLFSRGNDEFFKRRLGARGLVEGTSGTVGERVT
ncbi:MAG: hypothetical protein LBD14_00470 [Puniceicoccales bacterium]|nr:hypothetical protein [Puniceicoccales bacterium]